MGSLAVANNMGGDYGAKDHLVMQIKAFQKGSEAQRELWHAFCDTHLEGHRDPNRAEAETLAYFLEIHCGVGAGEGVALQQKAMGAYASPMAAAPKMAAGSA